MSDEFYETTLTFNFKDYKIKPLVIKVKKLKSEIPLIDVSPYDIPLEYKLKVDDLREVENQVKEYLRQYNLELAEYGYISMGFESLPDLYSKFGYLTSENTSYLQFDVLTYELINKAEDFYRKYFYNDEASVYNGYKSWYIWFESKL